MPATVWMQATAVMQATIVASATSNSKDDSNIMTAHNSKNASNSRKRSYNRTTNTVWMPAKAGMLLKSEMTAAAGKIALSWMSSLISNRTARIDSREDSNIQQGHQQAATVRNSQLAH
jgi:hypothetical protein